MQDGMQDGMEDAEEGLKKGSWPAMGTIVNFATRCRRTAGPSSCWWGQSSGCARAGVTQWSMGLCDGVCP